MMDYLDWRGDLTLDQSPFNEVDNLLIAQLAYLNLDGLVPSPEQGGEVTAREACERYFALHDEQAIARQGFLVRMTAPVLRKLAETRRFAGTRLAHYVNEVDPEREMQFSAVHARLDDGTVYVAFRGTDSTLIGWKENFNMSFAAPVPSQLEAVRYLERTAGGGNGPPLRLGGHSKGGNLAVFAAVRCREPIRSRILEVYNNDGPGFDREFLASPAYREMLGRIRKFVPQTSVVGMLLEHDEEYTVIRSSQRGLLQHDALSWEVLGPRFVYVGQVTRESRLLDEMLRSWLDRMDRAQRERFAEALFGLFEAGGIETVDDLSRDKWKHLRGLVRLLNQSPEVKRVLARALKLLFLEGRRVFRDHRAQGKPFSKVSD